MFGSFLNSSYTARDLDKYIFSSLAHKLGYLNIGKANVAAITGLDGYSIPTLLDRKGYQRPKASILLKKK